MRDLVRQLDVPYNQPKSQSALGLLALDPADSAPKPAVIVLHEAFGLRAHVIDRVTRLAQLGYIAMAADLFGGRHMPGTREAASHLAATLVENRELLISRIQAGVDVVRDHPLTDPTRIAVIGYCFGGSAALEYGRSAPNVAGVACFHGRLTTAAPLKRAAKAPRFLVCTGAEDPLVPSEHINAFISEMRNARCDWQLCIYGRAAHAFTDPNSAELGIDGVAYNESADRRSWGALQSYLDEIFQKE